MSDINIGLTLPASDETAEKPVVDVRTDESNDAQAATM